MDKNELLFTVFDACRCGYLDFVRNVFEDYPSDINITNSVGQNCLMLCCEFNQVEIAKYLLSKRNINYLSSSLDEHWNCLHYALKYGNFRIAQLLLTQSGSTLFPKYALDTNGYNAFDLLPPNLSKKQVYDDIYCDKKKQNQRMRKIYNSSFSYILQKGSCQRVYGEMVCNLQVQGVLYSFGNNKHSQLGLDTNTKHRSTPKILKHLRNINIMDVACSGYHSIAVTADGSVYSWGNNSDGRCGLGYISNEYRPLIKRPALLTSESIKDITVVACSATLDHSTLLTDCGDVYVFGCNRNSEYINYTKKSMKLAWNNKLRPFCITDNCRYPMCFVSSAFERSVMIDNNHKVHFIGKTLNGNRKINTPSVINTSHAGIRNIGVEHACVGDNFLVLLLLNGTLLSMNRQKTDSDYMEFSRIRLNKPFKFRHHHNKREDVTIKGITCYNTDGATRCIAVTTKDDIYEWKAPSTDAVYVGHCFGGICSISCGPRLCILCNTMGECYAFGNIDGLGLSAKDKKLLNINPKEKNKMIRIITLSQIAKVFAAKDSVFVIQSFLWPNRNLLNAIHHHKEMNKLKNQQMEKTFWNHDIAQRKRNGNNVDHDDFDRLHNRNNHNLYDCYNTFEALSLDDIKHEDEKDDEKEEKKQHHKGKRSRKNTKKKHRKGNKTTKTTKISRITKATKTMKEAAVKKKIEAESGVNGLDEDRMSSVPSLVAYCEDLLIHQIDIQTVISLYTQSNRMGFHRISVFLSFVIIENIQHLMHFLLRDCSEQEVLFVEHLFKTKYYPYVAMNCAKYYGDPQYFSNKKRIIEEYRILPAVYPNYKQQLSAINITLRKIEAIEHKVQKFVLRFEREDAENKQDTDSDIEDENDADIIYLDSEEEQLQDTEKDKLFTQFTKTPLDRALQKLNPKERALYDSKLQILSEHNQILLQISNPQNFPNVQMMEKWKGKLKKKRNHKKHKEIINDGPDKYLKHVHLKEHNEYEKDAAGFVFFFDYDAYNKPKRKQPSKAVIYQTFNVKDAMEKDAKRARKKDKKQEKKRKNLSSKQIRSTSQIQRDASATKKVKKRRNRNRNNAANLLTQQNQNKAVQKQKAIHSKSKSKMKSKHISPKPKLHPNSTKQPHIRATKQAASQPHRTAASLTQIAPVSPITHPSPIDVVRRNREKKRLEQEISKLSNDVWDLSTKETENAPKEQESGSLSNILNGQKKQYEEQKQKQVLKQRHQKYEQYQETQNAWGSKQHTQQTNTKPIRPNTKKRNKKETEDKDKVLPAMKQKSAVELAQIEEMQLRSLAQHEYEWMINAPDAIDNKKDDYNSFLVQQQQLLASFHSNKSTDNNGNAASLGNHANYQRTQRSNYGNRGRGYNMRDDNDYYENNHHRGSEYDNRYNGNDNYNRGRCRSGYRGRYNHSNDRHNRYNNDDHQYNNNYHQRGSGRDRGRGSGRGRYNYDNNQQHTDYSSNQWRKK